MSLKQHRTQNRNPLGLFGLFGLIGLFGLFCLFGLLQTCQSDITYNGDKHLFLKMKIMALTSAFVRTFFTLPGRLRVKPLGVAVPELEREISLLVGPELRSNFLKRSFCVLDNLRTSGRCPPNESGIFLCYYRILFLANVCTLLEWGVN